MEVFNNYKKIKEIIEVYLNVKDRIEKSTTEMTSYLEYLKDVNLEEIPNEKEEEAIERAESILDRLDGIVESRKLVSKNGKETIELIDYAKLKIGSVMKSCENDEFHLEKVNDELISKIIELEERKRIRDVKPLQDQIDNINKISNIKVQELREKLTKRKKAEKEKLNAIINIEEIKQIESWTNMKMGNIIFDSDVDNWNKETSLFDQKIKRKSNLIFLIEDEDGNKFGGYVNAIIDIYDDYIKDPKSFVFSLKSNGRLNQMLKIDIQDSQHAFFMCSLSDNRLFGIGRGHDVCVYKENNKNQSYCRQISFKYNGLENALCGKLSNFTLKRLNVIQML